MRRGIFPRLARDGIRKNSRIYIPYWLTCTMCACMFYLMQTLSRNPVIRRMRGGASTTTILMLGSIVIAVFSVIFLFYTNTFLMRRRRKEFGLYSVLGMDRWSLTRVLLWETSITAFLTITAGLVCGIAVSKLGELLLLRLVGDAAQKGFFISLPSIASTVLLFGVIFLLLLLNGVRQVHFSAVTELLKSENTGERPPKGNRFIALAGLVILAAAYVIAVTIEQPLTALLMFFVAVIMVIIATYILMITGSVTLCRLLQKHKKYYYRTRHFVSVSSMAYRMKRNGAGLASICILATMVLVMISSTSCLYFGEEQTIMESYPREICTEYSLESFDEIDDIRACFRGAAAEAADEKGYEITNILDTCVVTTTGLYENGNVILDPSQADLDILQYERTAVFCFISAEDYDRVADAPVAVNAGEAIVYSPDLAVDADTLTFGSVSFRVAETLDEMAFTGVGKRITYPVVLLIVDDVAASLDPLRNVTTESGVYVLDYEWIYYFDLGITDAEEKEFRSIQMSKFTEGFSTLRYYSYACRELERTDIYGSYGGFFFLGILLSIVFLSAAVLIIYYKQLSEGYEDMGRFAILRKVGMTAEDIRSSVSNQMLTVFFFPLGLAVVHLCFAFPMIRRLLMLFGLYDTGLLMLAAAAATAVFALFYVCVYRATTGVYLRLVSAGRAE